jgi:hypothetical protein
MDRDIVRNEGSQSSLPVNEQDSVTRRERASFTPPDGARRRKQHRPGCQMNSEITVEKTELEPDKNGQEWSEEYALLHHGVRTLAAWSAQELEPADPRTTALSSLLAEAGLTLDEVRALLQMIQIPRFLPATRKPGLRACQEMKR